MAPTTEPDPIAVGGDLKQMVEADFRGEDATVSLYREAIKLATEAGDPVPRLLYEEVLEDEEEHRKAFSDLLR